MSSNKHTNTFKELYKQKSTKPQIESLYLLFNKLYKLQSWWPIITYQTTY